MLRPTCIVGLLGRNILHQQNLVTVRTKVVYPVSLTKKSDRLKQWHKDNKELFGPLLETSKEKKLRLTQKTPRNSNQRQNKSSETEHITISSTVSNSARQDTSTNGLPESQSSTDSRMRSRVLSGLSNSVVGSASVIKRGLKTLPTQHAAQSSSPAAAGYNSEDKILQIRQHKNDYSQEYPSVTLILNKTMSEESRTALEKWKQERIAEMGVEEFNRYYEAQMAVGTKFHETLKRYFTAPRGQLGVSRDVEGVWASVAPLLPSISAPRAIESNVVHPVLKYRGIIDAIADYEERPTLIEWKKSDKPRKAISLTYDNPVQLAAYFGAVAHDLNYKHLKVREALLVIAYTDGSRADAYRLRAEQLREHWAAWLARLEAYVEKHPPASGAATRLPGGKRLFEQDIGSLN